MQSIGLGQSELERIVLENAGSVLARSGSREKTALLADAMEQALRDVAKAIAENNARIAAQLEKAGIKLS